MHGPLPLALIGASLFAVPAAALAGPCLPAAAAFAAAGWLLACHARTPRRWCGLAGLPALLAAFEPPALPPPEVAPGPVRIVGVVTDVVRAPDLELCWVTIGGHASGLRLAMTGAVTCLRGDRIDVLAHASPPACPDLPTALHGDAGAAVVIPGPPSLARGIASMRAFAERTLLDGVAGDNAAMVTTLVLGRGTRPPTDLAAAHQATGLSHLLAVSGAHAAMLAHLLGLGTLRRGQRLARRPLHTALVLAVLAVYAAVAGGEPPVLRAVIAYTLAAVAAPLGRPFGLASGLLVPALVTCGVEPGALLGPSFLLSYAAVLGLSLARPPRPGSGWRGWLAAQFAASFWATVTTAPLTLLFFGQLAPWTVVLTPLLAPAVAALLVGGLALCVTAPVLPAVADLLGAALGRLADVYCTAVTLADSLPGTPIAALHLPGVWLLVVATAAAAAAFERWRGRRGTLAAVTLSGLPYFLPLAAKDDERFCLHAVGHGQAALLVGASGERAAIDCGSLTHPRLAARRLIAALPHRRLEALVVTHADLDHHNGAAHLLAAVQVVRAVLPERLAGSALERLLRAHGTAVQVLAPGASCRPIAGLDVFAPSLPPGAPDNDQSLWCRAAVGEASVLLCGDAEALGIAAALAGGIAAPADVLVLPHHGRANPLAPTLLARVQPSVCLASAAGADGETALAPLVRHHGAELHVTGRHGSIELRGAPVPRIATSETGRQVRRHGRDYR